jgi:hypothetical protein
METISIMEARCLQELCRRWHLWARLLTVGMSLRHHHHRRLLGPSSKDILANRTVAEVRLGARLINQGRQTSIQENCTSMTDQETHRKHSGHPSAEHTALLVLTCSATIARIP